VRDTGENNLITGGKIPNGNYEVPIVLQDRLLDLVTGAMIYPVTPTPGTHPLWIPEYFGNTPIINGRAYPFLNVEPRRYRLRFLNGSQARFFNMFLQGPSAGNLHIWVIGSEQGFLPAPAKVTSLLIAPGERFDTIVDFTGMKPGTTLTLKNNAKAPYPGGRGGEIPELMQFKVVPLVGTDTTSLPAALTLPSIDPPLTAPAATLWREIVLQEIMDPITGQPLEVLLDGERFDAHAPPNPPLIEEPNGTVNVWQFINTTGDAHPMHMHLVKYKVVSRQKFDAKRFLAAWDAWRILRIGARPSVAAFLLGAPTPPPPEETGWKDTAKAYPGEVLSIIAKFDLPASAPTGLHYYVCHCHILEHEENDMMFYYGVEKEEV
jgi:spore coat protein A